MQLCVALLKTELSLVCLSPREHNSRQGEESSGIINIPPSHKYFIGCCIVRVCSVFKGSLTFFVEVAWMIVLNVWLPCSKRSDFQTIKGEKGQGGDCARLTMEVQSQRVEDGTVGV